MKYNDTITIPFKGKEVRIVISGEFPMFNVADINAIVGRGKLENAVNRAKKKFWIEEDEAGLETRHFPKFEERGTPPQLVTSYEGVFFMSHREIPNDDPEEIIWRSVDPEFTGWLEDYVIESLYMILYDPENKFTFSIPRLFEVVETNESNLPIKRNQTNDDLTPGLRPGRKGAEMDYCNFVKYVYKGKGLRVALNEECPMFNVADINVILGNGNLEGAVNRAKEEYWMEKDENGSEFERYAEFEEVGTSAQLWTDYQGVIFLSHFMIQPYDSEKIHRKPVDIEFSEWFQDTVMEDLYGPCTHCQCICDECALSN
jgi:hypothetical protein